MSSYIQNQNNYMAKMQIFTEAKLPGQPFTLRLDSRFSDDEDDGWDHLDALNFEEVCINKKTKEEFSIQKKPYFYCEFKRGAAQKSAKNALSNSEVLKF